MLSLQLGILILVSVTASTRKISRSRGGCVDDMLHVADGRYSCELLVDKSHIYQVVLGAYDSRVDLCSKPGQSGCCKTCRELGLVKKRRKTRPKYAHSILMIEKKKSACKDRMLHVVDGFYSCSMLSDPDHPSQGHIAVYHRRQVLCSKPDHSGCCKTCNELRSGTGKTSLYGRESVVPGDSAPIQLPVQAVDGIELNAHCKDSGLNLAEGKFSCAMLVDEQAQNQTAKRAFTNRHELCNMPSQSGCCLTCTLYGIVDSQNSETFDKKEKRKPGYCRDSSLWLGDGSYDCSLLIHKHHKHQRWTGAFDNRKRLCSKAGFSGCCRTCLRHVIKRNKHHCKDEYVLVPRNKRTYACRELLHRQSDIYPDRFTLCRDNANTRCCKTCAKVAKTKPTHGSHRHSNMIRKPDGVATMHIGDSNPEPSRETIVSVNRAYLFMRAILDRFNRFMPKRNRHHHQQQ